MNAVLLVVIAALTFGAVTCDELRGPKTAGSILEALLFSARTGTAPRNASSSGISTHTGLTQVTAEDGLDVSGFIDGLLDNLNARIPATATAPDLDESFKIKVLFVKVKAKVQARDGLVLGVNRLQRFGEATLKMDGDRTLVLQVAAGLRDFQIGYNYKIKVAGVGPRGKMTVSVGACSARARLSVLVTSSVCQAKLDSFSLVDLGPLSVKATGMGPLNSVYSKLLTKTVNKQRDLIQAKIVEALQQAAGRTTIDCMPFLPRTVAPDGVGTLRGDSSPLPELAADQGV